MNKFYLIILLTGLAFSATAQAGRSGDSSFATRGMQQKMLKFYPNPASSIINFEFSKPVQESYNLKVFSFVGKKLYETGAVSQKTTVQLNDFFRGVYIFQLRDKTGRIVESGKFQVSK